jgi:hypothetical protein
MKRALIITVIASVLAVASAVPHPVVAASPPAVPVQMPEATPDSAPCTFREGVLLAAGGGCCQRQGICGCRGGKLKCCDGTTGVGCPCRADSSVDEGAFAEAL